MNVTIRGKDAFSVNCWATHHSQQWVVKRYSLCKFMSQEIIIKKRFGSSLKPPDISVRFWTKLYLFDRLPWKSPLHQRPQKSVQHTPRLYIQTEQRTDTTNLLGTTEAYVIKDKKCGRIKHVLPHIINYQHVLDASIHVYLLVLWYKVKYSFCARKRNILMGTFCYFAKALRVFDTITYQQRTLFIFICCSQRII
jgi:hypothetical protein